MSIAIDGFDILQRLGKHADAFAVVRADVDKQARALVVKCLKAKALGFEAIRDIHKALGTEQFGLVVEGLKDAEVKSILTRLDKHHPDLKGGSPSWRRQHLSALADGSSKPRPAPAKAAKKTAGKKTRLESETMAVYREGGKTKG
jgi:hypothetical protein